MTTWYSDHYGTDGDNDTSIAVPIKTVSAGISHGRVRYKRATITGLPLVTTPDILYFYTLHSSDRIINQWISSNGGSDAGAIDIGLYTSNSNHDGAVLDADLFSSAQAISTAIHKTAALVESGILQHEDTGKTLWEMYAVGDGSDTVDPNVNYDICGTVTTSFTTTDSILTLECIYTSGD
jgi:hypothetical protein